MFTWIWIFEIVLLALAGLAGRACSQPKSNPYGHTCEEFERGAHFDPYMTLDSMWKIFYFWANNSEVYPVIFSLPAKQRLERFRVVLEAAEPDLALQIAWRHATLLMEPRPGVMILLLHQGTPGAFRAIINVEQRSEERPHPVPLVKLADVRMKMVGRYIGMMSCEELTMYALSRLYEVPETEEECEEAAASIGFPKGGGRSHLYLTNLTSQREIDDEL
ncbi:hypothetical protein O0L34_g1225 [Tuta absoluta]|nr:hypothetical protein O0L34_g1225 [Tuta absoluta]